MNNQNYFIDLESIVPNLIETPQSGTLRLANVANSLKLVNSDGVSSAIGGDVVPKTGVNLTDANQTVQPVTDRVSRYKQVVALTVNRSKTLGITNVFAGMTVYIQREDTAGFTLSIINGGTGAGTLFTFAASPTEKQLAAFQFDGTNWALTGFYYVVTG